MAITRNEGTTDRAVRAVAGLAGIGYGATHLGQGAGVAALVVGGVLLATSAMGFCPIYRLLGASTCSTR